jgi:hypothetical protein
VLYCLNHTFSLHSLSPSLSFFFFLRILHTCIWRFLFFLYLLMHTGCFHSLVIMNKVVLRVRMQRPCWQQILFIWLYSQKRHSWTTLQFKCAVFEQTPFSFL